MKPRLTAQDGVALPAAMGTMLVIGLFVAALFALSIRASDSANVDSNSKRALAAAEAGLQTAIYRMNSIRPAIPSNMCLTTGAVAEEISGVRCPFAPGDLGNGASYEYYVTPELGANAVIAVSPGSRSSSAQSEDVMAGVRGRSQGSSSLRRDVVPESVIIVTLEPKFRGHLWTLSLS